MRLTISDDRVIGRAKNKSSFSIFFPSPRSRKKEASLLPSESLKIKRKQKLTAVDSVTPKIPAAATYAIFPPLVLAVYAKIMPSISLPAASIICESDVGSIFDLP